MAQKAIRQPVDAAVLCQRPDVFAPCGAQVIELVERMVELAVEPAAAVTPMLLVQRRQADACGDEAVVIECSPDRHQILREGATAQQDASVGLVVPRIAVEIFETLYSLSRSMARTS
ncbi:MAG: hypothetical protein LC715_01230 [Gammaproteobacteria bacterium]|nr:hypothetical protein [Gammaproteobacteria bacterium]